MKLLRFLPFLFAFVLLFTSCKETVDPDIDDPEEPTEIVDEDPKYTYNFKVILKETYNYTSKPDLSFPDLEATSYTVFTPFDGQEILIKSEGKEATFQYGALTELWGDIKQNNQGIKVEWPSDSDSIEVTFITEETEFYSKLEITKTFIPSETHNDHRIILNRPVKFVDHAAFVVEVPEDQPFYYDPPSNIESFEIYHNDEWVNLGKATSDGSNTNGCSELNSNPYVATWFFQALQNFPFQKTLKFRAINVNGNVFEFESDTQIAPYRLPLQSQSSVYRCVQFVSPINRISFDYENFNTETEIDNPSLRTENYFPLPQLYDTLIYEAYYNIENSFSGYYDFKLIPIEISTLTDTSITYERHQFWVDEYSYGTPVRNTRQNPIVDTVSVNILNKKINSYTLFPDIGNALDSSYVYFPPETSNPVSETVYTVSSSAGGPPSDFTEITLSKEDGIIELVRDIRSTSKWDNYYYRYTLIKD